MGRRSQIKKYAVLSSVDSTTNPESEPTDISGVDFITYQFELDASVDAGLEVQFCNDSNIDANSQFEPLNFNQTTPLDGSSDTEGVIHIENKGLKHLRLSIANNGGTGNVSAWVTGTVRGA